MSDPIVVLLHAFPFDARLWAPQAEVLAAAGWQVHAPNLPGFGGTELLLGSPSIDAVADAVLADLDNRGIDRAILGGSHLVDTSRWRCCASARKYLLRLSAVIPRLVRTPS